MAELSNSELRKWARIAVEEGDCFYESSICKRYLSEHPEDEDAFITPEFLDSLLPVEFFGYEITYQCNPINVCLGLKQFGELIPFPAIKTRGQLRQLIKLLKGE